MRGTARAAALTAVTCVLAQGPGTLQPESQPEVLLQKCQAPDSCTDEPSSVTLDAQWRWLHDEKLHNCMEDEDWNKTICSDPKACADACFLEAIGAEDYEALYGIKSVEHGLEIGFVTESEFGKTVGSRMYVMENVDTYKMFKLKNREIAFDVDVSSLPCGLNAAMYLVEMDAHGGRSQAGAKFGTGYCDSQCPHGMKFVDGQANLKDWDPRRGGHWASCCSEMDLFEANSMSAAFTAHPCSTVGPRTTEGPDCGDDATGDHYTGLCDKDGCDFNAYRLGNKNFYGPGGLGVDSSMPFTVVTQFLTADGTDEGDLVEIRRFYVQGGKVIENPKVKGIKGVKGNSLTEALCDASKEAFKACRVPGQDQGPFNKFKEVGGLRAMGEALGRGMVLVLSLWDDPATAMRWLDSAGEDLPDTTPGVLRGPCSRAEGDAGDLEATAADSFVRYSHIKYGAIGATTPGVDEGPPGASPEPGPEEGEDAEEPEEPKEPKTPAEPARPEEGEDAEEPEEPKEPKTPAEPARPEAPAAPAPAEGDGKWTCHFYEEGQDDDWCRGAGTQGEFEYTFGALDRCGGCLCCKRPVAGGAQPDQQPADSQPDQQPTDTQPDQQPADTQPDQQPADIVIHDCNVGDRFKWHHDKQEWCCVNWEIACPEELAASQPAPGPEEPVKLFADITSSAAGITRVHPEMAGTLAAVAMVALAAMAGVALRARNIEETESETESETEELEDAAG